MGGDHNQVVLLMGNEPQHWPELTKAQTAQRLATTIAKHFAEEK
jgi:hypothetical protein